MAARGAWLALSFFKNDLQTLQHNTCVAVKILPITEQRRGGKYFNRLRYFKRFKKENLPDVYAGFVDETIRKQNHALVNNIVNEVPDYKEKVIGEARRRRNIYEWKKSMKHLNVDRPKSNIKLSKEQIVHIKLLHEENPLEWTKSAIAASLNVDYDVVASALKQKNITNLLQDDSKDTYTNSSSLQLYKPSTEVHQENKTRNEPKIDTTKSPTIENSWFMGFQEKIPNNFTKPMEEFFPEDLEMENTDLSELDDHANILYGEPTDSEEIEEELYDDELGIQHNRDADEVIFAETDFEVVTKDGINYYDKNGMFVYRIV